MKRFSDSQYRRAVEALALLLWCCRTGKGRTDSLKELSGPDRALHRKMARELVDIARSDLGAQCVICGCTNAQACDGGCAWTLVNGVTGEGVCSACLKGED